MKEKQSPLQTFKKGLQLFLWFAKIGCFTFGGGWSILAQMEQEFIAKRQMITKDDLMDLTAVGKSLPGIMITNITMLFGYQIAGWFGGLCAVFGVAFPAVVILTIVTSCYNLLRDNFWFACALRGISCAVIPIIGGAAWSMGQAVFGTKSGCLICLAALLLILLTDVSNIVLIAFGVLIALAWMKWEDCRGLS